MAVAVFASILGNALWNRMSRLLPLTLSGQMILFETLFAMIYGLGWARRLLTVLEIAVFVMLTAGVTLCLAAHRRPADDWHAEDGSFPASSYGRLNQRQLSGSRFKLTNGRFVGDCRIVSNQREQSPRGIA